MKELGRFRFGWLGSLDLVSLFLWVKVLGRFSVFPSVVVRCVRMLKKSLIVGLSFLCLNFKE